MTSPACPGGWCFPEDPALKALDARVVWNARDAPAAVVLAAPIPLGIAIPEEIPAARIAWSRATKGYHAVRLKNGPLVVSADALPSGRPLGLLLAFDNHWEARCAAITRLRASLLDCASPPDPFTLPQRARVTLALRTLDARSLGVRYRAIALQLYDAGRLTLEPWRTSSLKAQIARLATHGRHLSVHGYRALLLGRSPTGRWHDA